MSGEFLIFMLLALIAIVGGVMMLNLTKVVHMVVALVFTFISVAGVYVMLSAEFIAVVQILIYSGAITIMMLFGIMLTRHNDNSEPKAGRIRKILIFLSILGFGLVFYLGIYNVEFTQEATTLHENNTEQIGLAIYSKYVIPFELTSVILLVALIGAIILAKRDDLEEADKE
ncbi:NADH-quinone oxidoreductase subunit J [Cytobacillus horneckiae]|uniref:NADH-quinone oxidoreductase subunit J n=1 Tax=Cytobacillus horneckiae TaxID=549687 RepID=A0A2N0ZFV6_9BACI|nr:NADH-quinone oxidoreductase subunit J [Cytobacillus horneckiae]MEC1154418.1 NADH-quinone oxidoreductase subunit J [Cytobacillus horneckiae]MED2937753.1 NADH-quinone oxidoreductase subunit J [Cytobacillus horneckiae]PKG28402.1 NADH-quinone oxidoreductase subunit J [Cytobacillus horneckiae]